MAEFTLDHVNDMYIDVLRELGNIGAGNATTAIAQMLGERLNMEVPSVQLMEASELGGAICDEEETIVGIFLEVQGDIDGSMMFLMNMESAHIVVNKLMMRDVDYREPFDEMDLSALASLTNLKILPSVPYIAVDMAAAILSVPAIMFGQYGDNALFIETEFGDEKEMQGYFILMPEQESYAKILKALGIIS